MRHFFNACDTFNAAMFHRPQLRSQGARCGLQQSGHVNVISAKANADFAQSRTTILIEALYIFGDFAALQHAERFSHLERNAAAHAFKAFAFFEILQRPEQFLHMRRKPQIETRLHQLERRTCQLFIGQHAHARCQHMITSDHFANSFAKPTDRAVIGENESFIHRFMNALRATFDFARQGFLGGRIQRARSLTISLRIRGEAKPMKLTNVLTLDQHIPICGDFRFQHRILSQAAHQNARSPVHEPLGEALM